MKWRTRAVACIPAALGAIVVATILLVLHAWFRVTAGEVLLLLGVWGIVAAVKGLPATRTMQSENALLLLFWTAFVALLVGGVSMLRGGALG